VGDCPHASCLTSHSRSVPFHPPRSFNRVPTFRRSWVCRLSINSCLQDDHGWYWGDDAGERAKAPHMRISSSSKGVLKGPFRTVSPETPPGRKTGWDSCSNSAAGTRVDGDEEDIGFLRDHMWGPRKSRSTIISKFKSMGLQRVRGIWRWSAEIALDHHLRIREYVAVDGELPIEIAAHFALHLVDLSKREHALRHNAP
jgi:hypothetical protein